jgi:hypothetical protein
MKTIEKKQIFWNVINSVLSGLLVFAGAAAGEVADHGFSAAALPELSTGLILAVCTSIVVALTKFKDFWDGEKKDFAVNMFNII